ncbi:MAG: hypothetical protein MJ239_06560 [Bacilli bacterium]|nr:hypothetical protein [Bacilli bacterium]
MKRSFKKTYIFVLLGAGLLLSSCGNQASTASSFSETTSYSSESQSKSSQSAPSSKTSSSSSQSSSLKKIEGVIFEDEHVVYDGLSHTIVPKNVPEFASYSYVGTSSYVKLNENGYTIKIKVTADGYETLNLSAKLYIENPSIEGVKFEDTTFLYNYESHSLTAQNLPKYSTVKYRCLNHSGMTNEATEPGEYRIEATIECYGYKTLVTTATMTIVNPVVIKTDSTKKAYEFDENTPREELSNKLKEGNYTVHVSSESVRKIERTGEIYRHVYFSDMNIGVTNDSYFKIEKSWKSKESGTYDGAYFSTAVKNGDLMVMGEDYGSGELEFSKAPSIAFNETYNKYGYWIDAYTVETPEDKYQGISAGGYVTNFYECEVTKNKVVFKVHNYYFHPDDTGISEPIINDELVVYTITNIGNTVVDLPEFMQGLNGDVSSYYPGKFTLDSFEYTFLGAYDEEQCFRASVELSYLDLAVLRKTEFVLQPQFFDVGVSVLSFSRYPEFEEYEGLTLNVYFDEKGEYQGENAKYGSVRKSVADRSYTYWSLNGGTINYYGMW